tara:strand:+ start:165 stop:380 length:216 start_codon:yes stop_codon:yes gene_type:complete
MKYFCLDRDSCGYTELLTLEQINKENFSQPFRNCNQCNYYMIIVPDDFSLETMNDLLNGIKAINKIYKEKK